MINNTTWRIRDMFQCSSLVLLARFWLFRRRQCLQPSYLASRAALTASSIMLHGVGGYILQDARNCGLPLDGGHMDMAKKRPTETKRMRERDATGWGIILMNLFRSLSWGRWLLCTHSYISSNGRHWKMG